MAVNSAQEQMANHKLIKENLLNFNIQVALLQSK
jgi:hypothetical protein